MDAFKFLPMWYDKWNVQNKLPDPLLRQGVRRLLRQRLLQEDKGDPESQQTHLSQLIDQLRSSPIAIYPGNGQYYELSAAFYKYCLGQHLKYSCCYWRTDTTDLDTAEKDMLELTCQRAALRDGQKVLELGCGWGSLSFFMAEKYPASQFTAVSGSRIQKEYIDGQIRSRGLHNLRVITADMNHFNDDMVIEKHWQVSGRHYGRTAEAWLQNMDQHRTDILPLFRQTYGEQDAPQWWAWWRLFFMACAELWNYRDGREWIVSHYLFHPVHK